jgi:hypothetical protein
MEERVNSITGGCMCGAVRYEVSGKPFWVGHCHCVSCRRHTGAAVVTFAGFKEDQVTFTKEERRIYNSSPGVGRAFCGQCGTPLTWEGQSEVLERGMIIEFHISTLDDPNAFIPTNHLFYPERIAWFDVADDLARYHGFDFDSEIIGRGPAHYNLSR